MEQKQRQKKSFHQTYLKAKGTGEYLDSISIPPILQYPVDRKIYIHSDDHQPVL
jgi:hypothetical protein